MTKTPSPIWLSGDVLFNQYEVKGTLGQGGMGTVYQVHHRGWNLDVAVKRPKPELFTKGLGKEDFFREAETWINLSLHPHIVSCYYVRLLEEIPCIFAEYISGGSLASWIKQRHLYQGGDEQTLERLLDMAIQFAWGLHAAHEQGLVHQDVKPDNVLLTPDGWVKVTDFGLAKVRAMAGGNALPALGEDQSILVSSGGMTPAYCSPEQAARQPLGRKTDIWSWAVSILQMFVGRVTWLAGPIADEALTEYLHRGPVDLRIPSMPTELAALLRHCFQRRPEDRPANMAEVAAVLLLIYQQKVGRAYPHAVPQPTKALAATLNNRALSLFDLGKVKQAMLAWEQALRVDPQHLEANYNQRVVLWRQGKLSDDALINQLKMVRSAQIQSGRGSYLLAQFYLEQGDVITVLELLRKAAQETPHEEEVEKLLAQANSLPSSYEECYLDDMYGWIISEGLSANGRWLVCGYQDGVIRLGDVVTDCCLCTFEGHTDTVTSVSISEDGRWIVSGSQDHTVRIWEATTGHCTHILQGHTGTVTSVSISEDGRWIVSGSEDDTVQYWDAVTGRRKQVFRNLSHSAEVVCLSEDGRWIVAAFRDGTARRWERRPFQCPPCFLVPSRFHAFTDVMQTDVFARRLLEQASHTLKTQQFAQALDILSQLRSLPGWERHSQCMDAWASLSRHCFRAHLRACWHVKTVEIVPQELWGGCPVCVDRNGNWAASSSSDGSIWLWEVKAGRYLQRFKGHHDRVNAICISSDGSLLISGSSDATIRLWETATGRCLRILQGHTGMVTSVSISEDGRWIVSGSSDRNIRVWETATGRCLRILEGHRKGNAVISVSLSKNGCWIASAGSDDRVVRVWETATGAVCIN